jgi:hypothetical protein
MSSPDGSVYVLDSLNEGRIFNGRLSYDKGAGIIHTLRYLINNDTLFFSTLRLFQNEYKDSTATGIQFRDFVASATGIDLTPYFNEWYFGEGFPTYSARWNTVGTDLILELTHTTSRPLVTPTFTNPIDVRFSRSGQADTTIRFAISSNLDQFMVPNVGTITNLTFIDPNNWVINKMGTKVKDVNFFLGLDETAQTEVSIHPNPFDAHVIVEVPSNMKVDNLFVYDASGRKVMSKVITNTSTIDVSQLPASETYLFVLTQQDRVVHTTKLVK